MSNSDQRENADVLSLPKETNEKIQAFESRKEQQKQYNSEARGRIMRILTRFRAGVYGEDDVPAKSVQESIKLKRENQSQVGVSDITGNPNVDRVQQARLGLSREDSGTMKFRERVILLRKLFNQRKERVRDAGRALTDRVSAGLTAMSNFGPVSLPEKI